MSQFVEADKDIGRIAVSGSDGDFSWSGLQSEKIAGMLKELKVPVGHPVIIYGHKEALFPAAILSSIHSAIAYIPIDTIYPKDRITKIAEKFDDKKKLAEDYLKSHLG